MTARVEQAARAVMALQAVGLVVGVATQAVIAHAFGTARDLGLYTVAVAVVSFLADWFLRDAMLITLVPPLRTARTVPDAPSGDGQAQAIAWTFVGGAFAAAALLAIAAEPLVAALAPGFDGPETIRAARMLRALLPSLPLAAVTSCLQAELQAQERFALPAAATAARSGVAFVIVVAGVRTLGVFALPAGFVVGYAVAFLLLSPAWRAAFAWASRPLVRPLRETLGGHLGPVGGVLALGAAGHLNLLTDRWFASRLSPDALAQLGYAERFRFPVMALFAVVVSGPALTYLSEAAGRRDWDQARTTIRQAASWVASMALPTLVVLACARREVVAAWLERGAFSPHDTARVSAVLACLLPAFAVNAFSPLLIAAFFALGRTRPLVTIVAVEVVANVVLDALWVGRFGLSGLALATSAATALANLALWKVLRDEIGGFGHVSPARIARTGLELGLLAAAVTFGLRVTVAWPAAARVGLATALGGGALAIELATGFRRDTTGASPR